MERAIRTENTRRNTRRTASKDAIALLKADLASKICHALKVHTTIEEEIFYPAFLTATDDTDMHHVKVEEKPGGMFSKTRKSGMEFDHVGERMKPRKAELEGNGSVMSRRLVVLDS